MMNQISDKVYLGNFLSAKDEINLIKNNINRVLSCLGYCTLKYNNESIQHKILDLDDTSDTNIIQYFKEALKFIDESDKILVHCLCGVSRSASIVIAYFMWKNKLTYDESFNKVSERRIVSPNLGFIKQLEIFEDKLKEFDYDLDKIDFQNIKWPIVE